MVTFTTAADTTLLLAIAPCTQSGHVPNLARSVGATAGAATVMRDVDDTACDSVQILNPTGIQLAERSISQTADGVQIIWTTVNESKMIGFRVYRSNGVNATLIDPVSTSASADGLIPAQKAGQSSGASYRLLDAGATLNLGDAYILEIVKNDGTTERSVVGVITGGAIFLPIVAK